MMVDNAARASIAGTLRTLPAAHFAEFILAVVRPRLIERHLPFADVLP